MITDAFYYSQNEYLRNKYIHRKNAYISTQIYINFKFYSTVIIPEYGFVNKAYNCAVYIGTKYY